MTHIRVESVSFLPCVGHHIIAVDARLHVLQLSDHGRCIVGARMQRCPLLTPLWVLTATTVELPLSLSLYGEMM